MTAEGSNPDLDDGNPSRATELGNACVREHNRLGLAYGGPRNVWNVKRRHILGLKTPSAQIPTGCTGTLKWCTGTLLLLPVFE